MRSVPLALLWELWRHGRLYLLGGALAANIWPAILFTALRHHGAIEPGEPYQILIHVVLVQINMVIFAAAVFSAQGNLARLYAKPLPSSALVAWHLWPLMVLTALESAASIALLNLQFELGWPVWGPALFAAVAAGSLAAALWLTENSGWVVVALGTVLIGPGLWFKSRYGEVFSQPVAWWNLMTPGEVATMLAIALVSYLVAVVGVSRNRRGEPLPSLGILAWLDRLLDPAPYAGLPFRSPRDAQSWYEWRKKGVAMPAAVSIGMLIGIGIWLMGSRRGDDLLHGFVSGGALVSVIAMIGGMILGNCGADDAHYEMGSFLATRPLTNIDLARTILKTAVKSVALAWFIWAVATLALYSLLWATRGNRPELPRELSWWYLPATLIAAWTVTGLLTSVGLTGRSWLFIALLCGLCVIFVGFTLFANLALPRLEQTPFLRNVMAVSAVLATVAAGYAFAAARARRLIGSTTLYVAGGVWLASCALLAAANVVHVVERPPLFLMLSGVGALALAPLALAPLALAWNRTR